MTRKDYELVARALANQRLKIRDRTSVEYITLDETVETMAATFALMNDNFKKDIFMEAASHGKSGYD
ncbi:MAG: hypothetical protein V3V74_02195 [Nitrosomonadaceae bacterium]